MAAASPRLREFTFAELHAATGGFSDLLGEGGLGKVYRGRMVLPVGGSSASDGGNSADVAGYVAELETECEVAVKVMKGSPTPAEFERFSAHVKASSAINHPNVLRLEGVALNMEKRLLLVYELVYLGDLKAYLTRVRRNEDRFPWKDRVKVVLGCAEALAVIHEKRFIHGDFKPSRVLLRQDLTPVVAGVGVNRADEEWDIRIPSAAISTPGYIDPNYVHTGEIRQTTDIYSFGVFLLELIFGYDPLDKRFEELKKVVSHGDFNDPSLVTDPGIEGEWNKVHVLQMIILARFATYPDLVRRPKMGYLAAKLRGIWSVISSYQ